MRGTGEKSEQYGDKHEKNTLGGAVTYRSDMAAVFPMNRWTVVRSSGLQSFVA